jgi:hypothetical protein
MGIEALAQALALAALGHGSVKWHAVTLRDSSAFAGHTFSQMTSAMPNYG